MRRELENHVASALGSVAAARADGVESPRAEIYDAAEHIWKAASFAGERRASEWLVEAAWAVLHDAQLPPFDIDSF
jgi:hypothetical protein